MNRETLSSRVATVSKLVGEFTLRSGVVATEYFDKYRFESDPVLLAAIAEHARRRALVQRWVQRRSTPWSVAWHALECLDYD